MDRDSLNGQVVSPWWQRVGASPWVLALLPLLILGLLVWLFLVYGPVGVFRAALPPQEELTIDRIALRTPAEIKIHVTNTGPKSVTIAQILVDDAYQLYSLDGGPKISRFGRATLTVLYPWVEGEPLEIAVVTSTGETFTRKVDIATETPVINRRYLTTFTLLGTYAGLIPVFVGLLWLPFIRHLERRWLNFLLALTVGLLLFLGIDAIAEALALATQEVAESLHGPSLVLLGVAGAFSALMLATPRSHKTAASERATSLSLAYFIALGIGLHNLGEGLAIGTAYTIGNVALGSLLVVGFMVHNATEGLAIVAPVSAGRVQLYHFVLMGLLAGGPTIVGTWVGGFTSLAWLSTLFLAVGAGALFQVLYQVGRLVLQGSEGAKGGYVASGFLLGLVVMYMTGLLVVA